VAIMPNAGEAFHRRCRPGKPGCRESVDARDGIEVRLSSRSARRLVPMLCDRPHSAARPGANGTTLPVATFVKIKRATGGAAAKVPPQLQS